MSVAQVAPAAEGVACRWRSGLGSHGGPGLRRAPPGTEQRTARAPRCNRPSSFEVWPEELSLEATASSQRTRTASHASLSSEADGRELFRIAPPEKAGEAKANARVHIHVSLACSSLMSPGPPAA